MLDKKELKNKSFNSVEAIKHFRKLMHDLLAERFNSTPSKLDVAIGRGLKLIREFWAFDDVVLLECSKSDKAFENYYSCKSSRIKNNLSDNIHHHIPWIADQIARDKFVSLVHLPHDLPEHAEIDRTFCLKEKIQSVFVLPIKIRESILGGMLFVSRRPWPPLTPEQIEELHCLSVIFAGALERKKDAERIHELLQFEHLLAEISAAYINLSTRKIKAVLKNDFGRLARLLDADRCILYMFDEDKISFKFDIPFVWWPERDNRLVQKHIKRLEEDPRFFDDYQYFFDKWRKGQVVKFTSIEDLPEEAAAVKERYRQFGAKSSLSIPISVGGVTMGALVISTIRVHRSWSEDLIQRVRVFGEIFINALMRKRSEEQLQKAFSEIKQLKERIEADYTYLKEEINLENDFSDIVGKSDALKRILLKVKQVAPTNATVILQGETGSGKGLIGRTIHNLSKRKNRPFMQVNCAALAPSVIESELFGHEKGAFTGAQARRLGRFEMAHGTTLFLDEIGELPLEIQAKLLRVLEDGELERVGGGSTIKTDVRVIAATNRNIQKEVEAGRFRLDLWYRLNVFPIFVPPLRERQEDIPLFVSYFVAKYQQWIGKKFDRVPQEIIKALQSYAWPGNIRELENMIEKAVIISPDGRLQIELPSQPDGLFAKKQTLEEFEREYILTVLKSTGWTIKGPKGAALQLGLNPSTLRSRMQKLGIKRTSSR